MLKKITAVLQKNKWREKMNRKKAIKAISIVIVLCSIFFDIFTMCFNIGSCEDELTGDDKERIAEACGVNVDIDNISSITVMTNIMDTFFVIEIKNEEGFAENNSSLERIHYKRKYHRLLLPLELYTPVDLTAYIEEKTGNIYLSIFCNRNKELEQLYEEITARHK